MIPPGVGNIPIKNGIAAIAARRLRNKPRSAGNSRSATPVSFSAAPNTCTIVNSTVSVTNIYPVVCAHGFSAHSVVNRPHIAPGLTRSSTASSTVVSAIDRPNFTFKRSNPTSAASEAMIAINSYMLSRLPAQPPLPNSILLAISCRPPSGLYPFPLAYQSGSSANFFRASSTIISNAG